MDRCGGSRGGGQDWGSRHRGHGGHRPGPGLGCRRRSRDVHDPRRRRGLCRDRLWGRPARAPAWVCNAQPTLHHFQLRVVHAADTCEPVLPRLRVDHPVREAQLRRRAACSARHGRPMQQRHGDLRAEAGGQPERVVHRVAAAVGQVEVAELRIDLAEVRDRRDESGLQCLDGQDVLDSDPHRVAGEPLGVCDHDLVGIAAEDGAQCVDLG